MMKKLSVCLAFAFATAGCALTEDAVDIRYEAPANISVAAGAENVTLNISSTDGRVSNRDRVSTKKNGYGMEMAKIVAANDVVQEIGKSVQNELASLGFKIGPGGLDIILQTTNFYSDFKTGFWSAEAVAEVAFDLNARKADGSLVYSRSYRAVGVNKDVVVMMGEQAAPALRAALRDAVQLVVRDDALHQALVKAGTGEKSGPARKKPAAPTS